MIIAIFSIFYELPTVLYLVTSCGCFVIIMFPRKGKFILDMIYCVTVHTAKYVRL